MPRTRNPNYANPHWAQAAENLGRMISGPSGQQQLEFDMLASQRAGQDLENRQLASALDAENRMRTGMTYGGTPDGGAEAQALGGGRLEGPESGMPTMYSGLAQADPSATGHQVNVPTSQDYGPRQMLRDATLSGSGGDAPDLARALGGIDLAEGRATPDQMRAYMAGAGQEPGADLALTTGRADQLRAQDQQHDLAQIWADHEAGFQHSPEALVHDQLAGGNPEVAAVLSEELGVRGPLSSDEQIARDHRQGDPEAAAALSAIRYGEGPQAPGEMAGLDPGDVLDYEERVYGLLDQALPENMDDEDRRAVASRAVEIARRGGGNMTPTEAVQLAVQEGGGLDVDDRWFRADRYSLSGQPGAPGGQIAFPMGAGPQQGQPGPAGPAGQRNAGQAPDTAEGGLGRVLLIRDDGQEVTEADIRRTAEEEGMDPNQVIEFMLQSGAKPLGQGPGGGDIAVGDQLGARPLREPSGLR